MYAKQKLSPSRPRAAVFLSLFLAIVFLCAPTPSRADSLEDGLEALALKVCMPSRKQSVRVNWQEPPERPDIFSESAKNAFLAQLSACGLEITENSEAPLLNIAVQFTPSRLLLIAVGGAFASRSAHVIEIPRAALAVSNEVPPLVHLRKELLWQQEKPIHSAMEWHDSSTQEQFLLLISRGLFVRLRSKNEVWVEVDSAELPKSDRRSRIPDSTFVYKYPEAKLELLIAQKLCDFDPGGRLSFTCVDTNLGGKTAVRISSGCGGNPRDIWTDSSDYSQRDHIFFGRAKVAGAVFLPDDPMSRSLEMPGPVFDVGNTQDSKAVIAVVRNLVTGNYEVYRITLACAN